MTGLQFAGGLAFNKAGDLFYIDQLAGTVNRCHRLSSCTVLASGFVDPLFMHFDADWKHMWLADEGASEIYALNPDTGHVVSETPAVGGAGDPPFGIAPEPGSNY